MGKRFVRQGLAAGAAATLAVGCALAAAAPASADQVWYQGVGRASSDAACPGDNASELAQGWSTWKPSYAQWMNDGRGGWVCVRSRTWAKSSSATSGASEDVGTGAGCVAKSDTLWAYFMIGVILDPDDFDGETPLWEDASCTDNTLDYVATEFLVYATNEVAAQELCDSVVEETSADHEDGYDVWTCDD